MVRDGSEKRSGQRRWIGSRGKKEEELQVGRRGAQIKMATRNIFFPLVRFFRCVGAGQWAEQEVASGWADGARSQTNDRWCDGARRPEDPKVVAPSPSLVVARAASLSTLVAS